MENKKIYHKSNSFESRLQEGNWWDEGNECLNISNINKPPGYFVGTEREWIEELTAYAYSYPNEWEIVRRQYVREVLAPSRVVLQYYRDDEGYLRKDGADNVYLKIAGCNESLTYEILDGIGQMLEQHEEQLFWSALEYNTMDESSRRQWREQVEQKLRNHARGVKLSVSVVGSVEESAFLGDELYFDMLNNLYIIY